VLLLPAYFVAKQAAAAVPADLLQRMRMSRGLFAYALVSLFVLVLVTWSCVRLTSAMASAWPAGRSDWLLCLIALSPPVLSHSFLLFPETLMFAATCLVTAFAHHRPQCRGSDFREWAYLAAALGCAPWLHRKFLPFALALAVACWWMRRHDCRSLLPRQRAALLGLIVIPQALLFAWTWHHWGTLAGPQFIRGQRLDVANMPFGVLGLIADREYGLVAYAPFYVILPACLLLAVSEEWPLLLACACLFFPMAAFDEWWGDSLRRHVTLCRPCRSSRSVLHAA
jgi:hypothetical protein